MRQFILFLLSVSIVSCSNNIDIKDEKTNDHKYVINTDCYLIPPFNSKETREYSGFQDRSFWWSIKLNKQKESMEHFEKQYSPQNLRKTKREFIEKQSVNYGAKFHGLFVKHKTRGRHGYGLVIDCVDYRVHVNSWIRDEKLDEDEDQVIKSMLSLYIEDPEKITESMDVPITVDSDLMQYKGLDERLGYLFTKNNNSTDNFKLFVSDTRSIYNYAGNIKQYIETELGSNYIVTNSSLIDSTWVTKFELKSYMNQNKTKKIVSGINKVLLGTGHYFVAKYEGDFATNDSLMTDLVSKISFYK